MMPAAFNLYDDFVHSLQRASHPIRERDVIDAWKFCSLHFSIDLSPRADLMRLPDSAQTYI